MEDKICFITFYPQCHNPGLMKDVGQIPNTLGNNYKNIDTKLVSCILNMEDENIKNLTGVKIEKIPFVLKNDFITGIKYIWKNAKKVDWFNFYHGGRKVYYWTRFYKFLKPSGKVYLKMDLSYEGCKKYSGSKKELAIFEKTAKAVDIISVESEAIKEIVSKFSQADIKKICNGYFDTKKLVIKKTSERQNEFITVGRLGTPQKASDLLLEAFYKSSEKHNWNLRLVGSIDESFIEYKNSFFEKHPDMKSRVIFEGSITDKEKLYELYNSAKVFVLPSRWEGFPLVGPEASHCGCRMILTDIIPPIKELTADQKYGVSIKTNDVDALVDALVEEANRSTDENEPIYISEYAKDNLSWDGICSRLVEYMGM